MDKKFDELMEIIREETRLCRELAEREQRKTDLLVKGRVDDIIANGKIEQKRVHRLQELAAARARLCKDRHREPGLAPFTLMKLSERPDRPEALENGISLLRRAAEDLAAAGRRNGKLLEKSLRYLNEMTTLFPDTADCRQVGAGTITSAFSQNA